MTRKQVQLKESPASRGTRQRPLVINGIETVPLTEEHAQQATGALATLLALWWDKRVASDGEDSNIGPGG
ncbi:hypothetical protein NGB36_14835 [Streptomyces sp. RB6PN25]|uniref:Uncharacterized protein n=1 Tax=Streptomyces humicola TaxID=2953240 RepID=A0ABT1PW28_9ACTN|nr:hypothetical protein [Streptomyces humicola]MCQ4081849.1 hypothetical protein [Streptomyces humicola]